MHNLKKIPYMACLLLLLLICHRTSHAARISRGVTYKAEFKPFGDSLTWQHSIPPEPGAALALFFEFVLSPGTLTAQLAGSMSLDSESQTLAVYGTSGSLHSDGGVKLIGDIIIDMTISLSAFKEGASIDIKHRQSIPGFPKIDKGWNNLQQFSSFLLGSEPESVVLPAGIPKLLTYKLSAVKLGGIIGGAIVSGGTATAAAKQLVDYLTEYLDGGIAVNGGVVSDLKLRGEGITANGGSITHEDQPIPAPGLDLSQDSYRVESSYVEDFTYTLDFAVSADVYAQLTFSGITAFTYDKGIGETRIPILPEKKFDITFRTNPSPIVFSLDGEDDNGEENNINADDLTRPTPPVAAGDVYIPDPVLRELLTSKLKVYNIGRKIEKLPEVTMREFLAEGVTKLKLWDLGIRDITGLEAAIKLKHLYLGNTEIPFKNRISDISPLAGLMALEDLSIDDNNISDISPLTGLASLKYLSIENNNISDISPLAGLIALESLTSYDNNISDISPLAGLASLKTLILNDNNISDIPPLAGLVAIENLALSGNNISDISPLAGLASLKNLAITRNNILDISPLVKLTNLESVAIAGNPLDYPAHYMHCPTLEEGGVFIDWCGLPGYTFPRITLSKVSGDGQSGARGTRLAPFVVETRYAEQYYPYPNRRVIGKPFAKVPLRFTIAFGGDGTLSVEETTTDENGRAETTLTLGNWDATVNVFDWNNRLQMQFQAKVRTDLPPATAESTEAVGNNQTPDIRDALTEKLSEYNVETTPPVTMETYLAELDGLSLGGRGIRNLSGLEAATKLQYLFLSDNDISDLSTLASLTELKGLGLSRNSISDISALAGATNLLNLWLDDNNISDISALSALTALRGLYLGGNSITDITPLTGLTELRHLDLGDNPVSDILALEGLTALTNVDLGTQRLDYPFIYTQISALQTKGVEVHFTPRAPTVLLKVSGDAQSGEAGDTLEPFIVEVKDSDGYPFAGVPITFAVAVGSGTLSIEGAITDAAGRAQSALTLGDMETIVSVSAEKIPTPTYFTAGGNIDTFGPALRAALAKLLAEYNSSTTTPKTMGAYLASVTRLDLSALGVRDLSGLETATKLEYLSLSESGISDISDLASLTTLQDLVLSKNSITDISALAGLTALQNLWLDDNNVSDVSMLSGLMALKHLYLAGNNITNILPLTKLTALTHLELGIQRLDYASLYTYIPALQARGVDVQFADRVATVLSKVSGDAQLGEAGTALQPLVVEVKDADGYPFAGVRVTFAVLAGDGTLSVEETQTDVDGRAESTLTLGDINTTVTVSVGQDGLQTTFTATRIREIRDVSEKITGPWLWMIVPTEPWQGGAASTDIDSLAAASGGAVTETMIATQGANEGDKVGQLAWTLGEISATGWNNVNDTVTRIGLAQGNIDDHSSYALIILESATSQQNVPMKVGSDDAIKVWLNGKVVHRKPINRGASNFQDDFSVNLQQGDNILLVKVSERGGDWSMFVGIGGADVTPAYKSLGESPTISVVEESTTFSDDLENLVLYLPFDEGTGTTATDSSKHQNHGTLHKASWTQGKYGNAVDLSGERGSWVEVSDAPSLDITDEITLMAWVHPTQFTEEWLRIIVKTWAGDTAPWMVYGLYQQGGSNGKTGFIVSVNGGQEARCGNGPSPQLPLNTWTHLAATYDGTRMKLYYNGELKVETSAMGKIDTNDVPLSIGRNSEGDREHYIGLIDEVAVWRVALDATEIKQAMEGDIITEPIAEAATSDNFNDPFEGTALQNPNWRWQNEPTHWDVGETRENFLHIKSETNRDLWASDTSHFLYQETNADAFDVETHFFTRWDTSSGVNGLVVKSPADNDWVTLKFWAQGPGTKGHIQYQARGRGLVNDPAWQPEFGATELFFRLRKDGNTYTGWYKTDGGDPWVEIGSANVTLTPPLQLGIYAGIPVNTGSMEVDYAYFRNTVDTAVQAAPTLNTATVIIPIETALLPNYPNPFNPETWLPYQLLAPADVTLTIYNIQGIVVRKLSFGHQSAGIYHSRSRAAYWDSRNEVGEPVASGVYFYTLTAGDFTATRKMLIRK